MKEIQAVAVFCGSKTGHNPLFAQHTEELGRLIAAQGLKLIYGGGSTGLMGLVADNVLAGGGAVVGIIPEILVKWEHQHPGLSELAVVPDMHTRKKLMYERCDAAIVLPGGFGTLDELFEMLTWNQLKIHNKKIFVLNSAGFYNHLRHHLETLQTQGFLYDRLEDRIQFCTEPTEIFADPALSSAM